MLNNDVGTPCASFEILWASPASPSSHICGSPSASYRNILAMIRTCWATGSYLSHLRAGKHGDQPMARGDRSWWKYPFPSRVSEDMFFWLLKRLSRRVKPGVTSGSCHQWWPLVMFLAPPLFSCLVLLFPTVALQSELCLGFCFLGNWEGAECARETVQDRPSVWVPLTHRGDLGGVPCPWY